MRRSQAIFGAGLVAAVLGLANASWAEPTPDQLRNTIREYIAQQEATTGAFTIDDPRQAGSPRTLTLLRVHERVGKTGNYYYSCTDMKDAATGDLLDLDFDVAENAGTLNVVDVRIHKDNGNPRYTYDDTGRMVPVAP